MFYKFPNDQVNHCGKILLSDIQETEEVHLTYFWPGIYSSSLWGSSASYQDSLGITALENGPTLLWSLQLAYEIIEMKHWFWALIKFSFDIIWFGRWSVSGCEPLFESANEWLHAKEKHWGVYDPVQL